MCSRMGFPAPLPPTSEGSGWGQGRTPAWLLPPCVVSPPHPKLSREHLFDADVRIWDIPRPWGEEPIPGMGSCGMHGQTHPLFGTNVEGLQRFSRPVSSLFCTGVGESVGVRRVPPVIPFIPGIQSLLASADAGGASEHPCSTSRQRMEISLLVRSPPAPLEDPGITWVTRITRSSCCWQKPRGAAQLLPAHSEGLRTSSRKSRNAGKRAELLLRECHCTAQAHPSAWLAFVTVGTLLINDPELSAGARAFPKPGAAWAGPA